MLKDDHTIVYRSPGLVAPAEPPWHLRRAAMKCALTPLVLGSATFALSMLTRIRMFELAWFLVVLVTPILIVIGLCCLLAFIWGERRQMIGRGRPGAKLGPIPFALLLLNLPALELLMYADNWVDSAMTLVVTNSTGRPVDRVIVTSDAGTKLFGPLPTGASQSVVVHHELNTTHWTSFTAGGAVIRTDQTSFNRDDFRYGPCNGVQIELGTVGDDLYALPRRN